MIPAHHTESKMLPAPRKAVLPSRNYKDIRSIRVGSSSGARELFTSLDMATAAMQRFGRYQRKNGLVLDIVNVSSLTHFGHPLYYRV